MLNTHKEVVFDIINDTQSHRSISWKLTFNLNLRWSQYNVYDSLNADISRLQINWFDFLSTVLGLSVNQLKNDFGIRKPEM
jgi:hypothetical protein